jgi:hypothetical protein
MVDGTGGVINSIGEAQGTATGTGTRSDDV